MFPKINPTTTKSWNELEALAKKGEILNTSVQFEKDPTRAEKFSCEIENFFIDFSKNQVNEEVLEGLLKLADECHLEEAITAQFSGEKINETEERAVLHSELRNLSETTDYSQMVSDELLKVEKFADEIISGGRKGHTGKKFTDIVNIGIGGSDLGPKMVTNALQPYWKGLTPHFISNVDAQQLVETLDSLNPETTLFVVASKTFTTQETLANAVTAKEWLTSHSNLTEGVSNHFVAVSTNKEQVEAFGISSENMFVFWDWVGGRYSLWSSIGLIIACTVGFDNFKKLLSGAETMDTHFKTSDFSQNLPVLAALIGIWNANFLDYESIAILPYDHRLRFLPSYLQQADMESNGKNTDRNGSRVAYQTGPIVWGEPGTNGQHAFYQLIHQGTKIIPCDFIGVAQPAHEHQDHHSKLLANFFAQSEALLVGKKDIVDNPKQAPYRIFDGNRPSTSILLKDLSPFNLGQLIAFYEHKIFVQGAIWNIFSFDQWGVELGKILAKPILKEIETESTGDHDSSTSGLMRKYQDMRK